MAPKQKQGRKPADFGSMTDTELIQELARLYAECLSRLHVHLEVGAGELEAEPILEAIEAGQSLAGKLHTLTSHFRHGAFGGESLTGWTWGLWTFRSHLDEAAVRLTIGTDDA